MASGKQSHLKNAYAKGCDLHDNASTATAAAGVAYNVTMAEALAVAAALELVLALRAMLLNVKTNVRTPAPAARTGQRSKPCPPAPQRNKCAHLAQRLEVLEPVLRRGTVRTQIARPPAARSRRALRRRLGTTLARSG